jgi:hypothetical protein
MLNKIQLPVAAVALMALAPSPGGGRARAAPLSTSPAAAAAAVGDFDGACTLPARDEAEKIYLEASVALAEHRLDQVEGLLQKLPKGSAEALELAWRVAHARGDLGAIGATAARLCKKGEPTGRACADAELYRRKMTRQAVELAEAGELPLSPTAPVPALAARFAGAAKIAGAGAPFAERGAVIDTGASQTVVSALLAEKLGLKATKRAFPIAVAAGGAVTEARLAVLPLMQLGPASVRNLPVLVVDMPNLERVGISAIISPQQAFDSLRFSLDLERRVLGLEHSGAEALEAGVPYYGIGFDLAVRAEVGGGPPALFGVDTGLDGAVALSGRYPGAPTAVPGAVLQGAGAAGAVAKGGALAVKVGAVEIPPQGPCLVSEMPARRPFEIAGFLGNALWSRGGRLVVDTKARLVSITAPKRPGLL